MANAIWCCPRCGSEAMGRGYRSEIGQVCSKDCQLTDQDLALRQALRSLLGGPMDETDYEEVERTTERILRGEFEKPWRPHTIFG